MLTYLTGGGLTLAAVACFSLLDGPTAVFTGIACALGAAVCLIRGAQREGGDGESPLS